MSTQSTSHLSIGEVLAELRDEFPDITISKIRFLESQGLIDPERTPSGYRKFYDDDLARLRWILHQQKENFLPLKVIKERLDQLGPGETLVYTDTVGTDAPDPAGVVEVVEANQADGPGPPREPPVEVERPEPARPARPAGRGRPPAFVPTLPADDGGAEDVAVSGQAHTRGDLCSAAGLEPGQLDQLESFGLLVPALEVGGEPRYDDAALDVARAAAGFFARGVEARHLRMYLTFAEREAVLFGQVLLPYARQRNPEARARLQDELVELATLGRRLRGALLREAVRDALTE
ncbi:MAG TPA: MerR family transcriptional regulator [Acidimicrobiia bacterium]